MLKVAMYLGELALGLGCIAAVGFVCWVIYIAITRLTRERRNYK